MRAALTTAAVEALILCCILSSPTDRLLCPPLALSLHRCIPPPTDIQLHPLVVLSLADHYTREVFAHPSGSHRCVGLLFGQQLGRTVKVLETVEMAFKEEKKGEPILELEAVETDMQLCQTTGRVQQLQRCRALQAAAGEMR